MRPAAAGAGRGLPVRGLGRRSRRGAARLLAAARSRLAPRQRARPRRADDRRLLAVDAGLGRRGRGHRRARLLDPQRGPGADALVRRRRRRGGRAAALLPRRRSGRCWRACSSGDGPIDVLDLAAQGLQMGDELHMRSQATGNLLIRDLLPAFAALGRRGRRRAFVAGNHHFFLNLTMAAAKCASLAAAGGRGSSVVTLISRNGTDVGIQVAGLPGPLVHGARRAGRGRAPARGLQRRRRRARHRRLGGDRVRRPGRDGAGRRARGRGVLRRRRGRRGRARTELMAQICAARSSRFTMPALDYAGTPVGIDARLVVELEIAPQITTGVLHASQRRGPDRRRRRAPAARAVPRRAGGAGRGAGVSVRGDRRADARVPLSPPASPSGRSDRLAASWPWSRRPACRGWPTRSPWDPARRSLGPRGGVDRARARARRAWKRDPPRAGRGAARRRRRRPLRRGRAPAARRGRRALRRAGLGDVPARRRAALALLGRGPGLTPRATTCSRARASPRPRWGTRWRRRPACGS